MAEGEDSEYIAKPPRHLTNMHAKNQEKRLIVILERAQLEAAKVIFCIPFLIGPIFYPRIFFY